MYCHNSLLKKLNASYVPQWGEASWNLAPAFLQVSLHVPFPFTDFALDYSAVINLSHEYNYILDPVSPSSKSLSLGTVLGSHLTHQLLKYN